MKHLKIALIVIQGFITLFTKGQTKVDVIESTFKIGAIEETLQYYGFAEGDQVIINLEEVNGKELKEFEVLAMPNISKFMDYKVKKLTDKVVNISQAGVYKFRFYNSSIAGRVYRLKIQRIPARLETEKFNTNVFWKTVSDTTYIPLQERYLVKADTAAIEVYNGDTQLSSQNAINGNSNRRKVNFVLPQNTIAWSFYIGTGSDGKAAYTEALEKFSKSAASAAYSIPGYGPLAYLALSGVPYFIKVMGGDNVQYYCLADDANAQLFDYGKPFRTIKSGDVTNEMARIPYAQAGRVYFGLVNDNLVDPISVNLKVVAVTVKQQWAVREIRKINVSNRQEPYLK